MKVVFLDYDGVVNTEMWNREGTESKYNFPKDRKVNNFQAVQWVSEFCEQNDYKIVVTSTWRLYKNYQKCLINGGLRSSIEILGKTKELSDKGWREQRGYEIQLYLQEHPEITEYLIFDDENFLLPEQKDHLIQTDPDVGFTIKNYYQACEKARSFKND